MGKVLNSIIGSLTLMDTEQQEYRTLNRELERNKKKRKKLERKIKKAGYTMRELKAEGRQIFETIANMDCDL